MDEYKPPLGIRPRRYWLEERLTELKEALERQLDYFQHVLSGVDSPDKRQFELAVRALGFASSLASELSGLLLDIQTERGATWGIDTENITKKRREGE